MAQKATMRIRSVGLKRQSNQLMILWGSSEKEVPPRPENPEQFPEEDARRWYDLEFAGWGIEKENIPESPRTGAAGREIIYLQPGGGFEYLDRYADTLRSVADREGIRLEVMDAGWDDERFRRNVNLAVESGPDLILMNPEDNDASTGWCRSINRAGIPLIGSNFLANRESHRYLVAWTGPDDWGQTRLLARHMADAMGRTGGYVILRHLEGNSSFYARTWGVITELAAYAPGMTCLDMAGGMDPDTVGNTLNRWLDEYGESLQGIFSADDSVSMEKTASILDARQRRDVVCVAAGSSNTGIRLILEERLLATAYQSPEIDGEIAMQTAIDWFDGVPVEPIRYLPKHIITQKDAAEFLDIEPRVDSVDLERLFRAVREFDWQGAYQFYGDLYLKVIESRVVTLERFQGICLQILTTLIGILREDGLPVEETLGTYDRMMKHLLKDTDVSSALDWLNHLSQETISRRMEKLDRQTPIQEIISFINSNLNEPISLKTLSHQFGISHAYLGQMFRKETGVKFNDYLNAERLERAKVMLKGSNAAINSIARELGYANPDYFYKVFKKLVGISASEYRKKKGMT